MDLWGCEEACKYPLSSPKLSVKENISAFKSVRNRRRTGPGASWTRVPCVWAIPGCFDKLRHPCQANQATGHRDRLKTPKTKQVWYGRRNSSSAQKWTSVCPWACGQGTPVVVEAPQATSHCGLQPSLQWMGIILWKLGAEETSSSGAEGKSGWGVGGWGILLDSTTWKNTWFGMCGKFLEDQLKMRCVNSLPVVVHKPVF